MNIKVYLNKLKDKVVDYDQKAQNPFFERRIGYNPFSGAFSQTYIWVEDDENGQDKQGGAKKA